MFFKTSWTPYSLYAVHENCCQSFPGIIWEIRPHPHPSPFPSSIHTWQLHQQPHPLPLSRARQFDGLCPRFARNKNVCSVKCFCKWPNGLMGCRAAGVQVVRSLAVDWFQICHLISQRKTSVSPSTRRHLETSKVAEKLAEGSSSKPNSGPMACNP